MFDRRWTSLISSALWAYVWWGSPGAASAQVPTPAQTAGNVTVQAPPGTATYNNYELVLHGITYGITDPGRPP